MSEKLDSLIEKHISLQDPQKFIAGIDEGDREVYIKAIKKKLADDIYAEIRDEIKNEAIAEAEEIIDEKAGMKQIDEFKKLMINGFAVAAFVGLFVNQLTEVIGYYKGIVKIESIIPTVIIAACFLFICICIFACLFLSELIQLLKKYKKKE